MVDTVSKILKVFAENHLFDEGVELIGSWCFQLYQKHLGVSYFPLRTQDIDFLIPNPYRGQKHTEFIQQLMNLGFSCDFKRDGSLYLWNADFKIEFITPEKGHGADQAINIKPLGFRAIPLRYVSLLLENPIKIKENGMEILVPNPAHFCLHKFVIASRRFKKDKFLKDLQQAICTSVIVETKEIQELFKTLPKRWRMQILKVFEKAEKELPLLVEEIQKLKFILQNSLKEEM